MNKAIALMLSLFSFNASGNLDPVQEHLIMSGYHAPYSEDTINNVLNKQKYEYQYYNNIQLDLDVKNNIWQEPADTWMWVLFWTIQLADIHSTHSGVKYDCISEANPLLPNVPTIAEMAVLKGVVLVPTYSAIGWGDITRAELITPLILGAGVVAHNYHLVNKARNRCNLR